MQRTTAVEVGLNQGWGGRAVVRAHTHIYIYIIHNIYIDMYVYMLYVCIFVYLSAILSHERKG